MGIFEVGLNAFCIMILLQDCGIHGVECGSLKVISPYNLIGSNTIMKCGFVGMGMALLAEVCHCWGGL